jgi:hypothetical protein
MGPNRYRSVRFPVVLGVLFAAVALTLLAVPAHAQLAPVKPGTGGLRLGACNDTDGDGYGSPGDASCPKAGNDCDDTNPAINPGATESCNGVDDNCDGHVDEAFTLSKESENSTGYDCQDGIDNDGDGKTDINDPDCAAAACYFTSGPSGSCSQGDAGGCCITGGSTVCTADGTGTECVLPSGVSQKIWAPEPPSSPSDAACFDGLDNNCDGKTDHLDPACQTAELCDGFDNDGDGLVDEIFSLNVSCTAGVGACEAKGKTVCKSDKTGTVCNATAGTPGTEGPAGSASCLDGKDNDCDGVSDLADSDCQSAEKCDGLDNDGDGKVDEDFTDLGASCSVGVGTCAVDGHKVCRADGTGTICDAVKGNPSPEGPSGASCSDGLDNDCDGTIDLADTGCGSSQLAVQCSLRYVTGKPGSDCEGWHTVNYDVSNGGPNTQVTAELLGIGTDGLVIQSLPAHAGDQAHLVSRLDPSDWKFTTKTTANTNKIGGGQTKSEVYAPVPMLRVTATDGANTATAYCSNIPYVDVIQPSGDVVSASQSSTTPVQVALPRVDPATLFVKVDGVDLFAGLGINPATDLSGGPVSGTLVIGGVNVTVSDLKLDIAGIGSLASNVLSFNLDGLGCGGHIIVVQGTPQAGARPDPLSSACDKDDLKDKATSVVFSIHVTNPTSGLVTSADPVPVQGEVCGGAHIASGYVNGKNFDVNGQQFTPGDGEDSADKVTLSFSTTLNHTDLAAVMAGTNTDTATFDPGSNLLFAEAQDDDGNRTYDSFTFAVGPVLVPGSLSPAVQAELQTITDAAVRQSIAQKILPAAGTTIHNAFTIGMTKDAIDTFFSQTCKNANDDAKKAIQDQLIGKKFPPKSVSVDAACDPDVTTSITDVTFDGDFSCKVDLADNLITMTASAPTMVIKTHSGGYCCDGCDFICWSEVIVDVDLKFTVPPDSSGTGIQFAFPIDEATFLNGGDIQGQFIHPSKTADGEVLHNGTEVNCFSAIAQFFEFLGKAIIDGLVFVFTFGQVDPPFDLTPSMDDVASSADLNGQLQVDTFPAHIKGMKPDEGAVAATDKLLVTEPVDAQFTPQGVSVALDGVFSSTFTDPDIPGSPGSAATPAPAPNPPQPGTGNTYFVASDDIVNQLFAAMSAQGEFKTVCKDAGKTVASFLPADCSTLTSAPLRGICQGIKGVSCATVTDGTALQTAAAVGACFGATQQHTVCASLPAGQQLVCNATPFLNLAGDMPFLFCGQTEVPPRLLLQDNPATDNAVEAGLRFKNFLVGVVLDRNKDGAVDDLSTVGVCTGATPEITGDCKFVAACIDFVLNTTLSLVNDGGKLKIVSTASGLVPQAADAGAICAGATTVIPDGSLVGGALSSPSTDDAAADANNLTPPLQVDGLDLGGIVKFNNPRLITIDTDGDPTFQDYLGITGEIEAP